MKPGSPFPKKSPYDPAFPVCWDGPLPTPSVRNAEDLRGVLADRSCTSTGPVYFMYRDISRSDADRSWLSAQHLRYDITVIPPLEICGEFIKTKGHYHPDNPSGTGYPELYEVSAGNAHFLIQNRDFSDIVMIAAFAGETVVIPPGYGHVTINPSINTVLQMANIVSTRFASDYQGYEALHGAVYFEKVKEGFVKNPAYQKSSPLRFVKVQRRAEVSGTITAPLYDLVEQRSPVLEFLNQPEKYASLFRELYH
ncbi:MAG: glucose-6-phosphate isomerase [Methanoregula sp.]|nr:glucose-6-phosphate isomerase [Methanoregula sp.]